MRRELEAALLGQAVVCRQSTVVWGGRGKLHRIAKVVPATATCLAGIASYTRLERHPITDRESLDVFPARFDNACGLVAQDDRLLDNASANASVLPIVKLALGLAHF